MYIALPYIPTTLRAIRATLDLMQEQLAERLGVSFATINRWEGGANMPQKAAQDAIAELAEEAGVGFGEAAATPTRPRRTDRVSVWSGVIDISNDYHKRRYLSILQIMVVATNLHRTVLITHGVSGRSWAGRTSLCA
jgi:transcriptional regulator with XRE-family HTH domain